MRAHTNLLLSASLLGVVSAHSLARRDATFDWSALNSSTNLSWTPCYDAFQCARFTVPLQYSNTSAGETQIALIMSPSNFSAGDPNYLGSILFNPGGPGGSGIQYILEMGAYFRAIIGPQYDLVGFDPRGVGETTPPLAMFESPAEALEFYGTYPQNVNDSESSLGRAYIQGQILGELANSRAKLVAESVGTAAVATDMLRISQAFGQDKVNYWGVSYGSVLGATFAAMFPDNVGRVIIDGVSDSHQWYFGVRDTSSLVNTDAAAMSIFAACVAAGPSRCAIWENSTELVHARVDRVLGSLRTMPLQLFNASSPTAAFAVVDYATVFDALFQTVYFPYSSAPLATEAIVALEHGDGSLAYQGSNTQLVNSFGAMCTGASAPFAPGLVDAIAPILCGDTIVNKSRTFAEVQGDYAAMRNLSIFADVWYPESVEACSTWPILSADRFNGSLETNTSNPLLLIGNTLDPVCPLESARNMSAGFGGSVVLQQNSTGHTSLSGFSTCTARAIRAFFQNGTLPTAGTVCQPDTAIFEAPGNSSALSGVTFGKRAGDEFGAARRALEAGVPFLKRTWLPGRR